MLTPPTTHAAITGELVAAAGIGVDAAEAGDEQHTGRAGSTLRRPGRRRACASATGMPTRTAAGGLLPTA